MGYTLQGHRYVPIERRGHCWPSAMLGTLWERGDRHRANGSEPYTLMHLRKPGSTERYPTSDERDAELEVTQAILAERAAELEATKTALERAKAKKRNELLTDMQARLDYYERNFGPLDRENPARELPPSTFQA